MTCVQSNLSNEKIYMFLLVKMMKLVLMWSMPSPMMEKVQRVKSSMLSVRTEVLDHSAPTMSMLSSHLSRGDWVSNNRKHIIPILGEILKRTIIITDSE